MTKFRIVTGPAINLPTPIPAVGGAAGIVYINRVDRPLVRAVYTIVGIGASLSKATKWSIFQAMSDPSDFDSKANAINQFAGQVSVIESSVQLGVGYGWQGWYWDSGPAAGTVCEGWGSQAGVAAGFNLRGRTTYLMKYNSTESGEFKMPPKPHAITAHGPR